MVIFYSLILLKKIIIDLYGCKLFRYLVWKFDGLSEQLFQNQLINQERKPTGMRYSKEIKEFALTVNYYSPKAFTYCRYLNA